MKRVFALILVAILTFAIVGCSEETVDKNNDGYEKLDQTLVYKDFYYDVNGEGTYEITGYKYSGVDPKEVKIPAKISGRDVTGIANDAFKACKTIKSVKIPSTIKYIGDFAFYDCDALTEVVIPSSVESLGKGVFQNCDNIKKVAINGTAIKVIDDQAFYGCKSLETADLHEGIVEIGDGAYYECTSLKKVTVPTTVKDLGDTAFYGCTSLEKATVLGEALGKPELDEEGKAIDHVIGKYAFSSCSPKLVITVTENSIFAVYAEGNDYKLNVVSKVAEAE